MQIVNFEPEDKILKPVSTLAMVPTTGTITRVARQAYIIMLHLAKEQGAEDPKTQMFCSPLNTIIKGYEGNRGTRSRLKTDLKSMVTHVVEWQSPTEGENSDWGALTLLSEVKLTMKNGEYWVHWAYPPTLRQEMLDPQIYAKLKRSTVSKFRSHAGLALYEICARYQDNPAHLTSRRPWRWWVPVLTGKPAVDDSKLEFRFFNRDCIKPAVEEINEISEFNVVSKPISVGRTVEFLQFEVHKKPVQKEEYAGPLEGASLFRAEKLGIPDAIAEDLWMRHGNEAFLSALNKLSQRLSQIASPVRSKVAYLKAVLANKEIEVENKYIAERSEKPMASDVESRVHPLQEKLAKMQESESNKLALARGEIQAMSAEDRTALLMELKAHAMEKNPSPYLIKQIEKGEWQSGIVLGELVTFYWKKTRGTAWSEAA